LAAELGVFHDPFTGRHRAPDESTFRRVMAGVDADALEDTVGRWIITSVSAAGAATGRRVYSVAGKTMRGSGPADAQLHLLAVLDQHTGAVLTQVDLASKTNELLCTPLREGPYRAGYWWASASVSVSA
jgi:hypothetical protein